MLITSASGKLNTIHSLPFDITNGIIGWSFVSTYWTINAVILKMATKNPASFYANPKLTYQLHQWMLVFGKKIENTLLHASLKLILHLHMETYTFNNGTSFIRNAMLAEINLVPRLYLLQTKIAKERRKAS